MKAKLRLLRESMLRARKFRDKIKLVATDEDCIRSALMSERLLSREIIQYCKKYSSRRWHNGRITKCGMEFKIGLFLSGENYPLFVIEWLDYGYYCGWISDNFWNTLKSEGRVKAKTPWWRF